MNQEIYNPNNYPIYAFPGVLQDVIVSLHQETHFPVEMIGSTVLAAAALTCQGYAEAISPFTGKPEPCSLYFLTLAPPSAGKSTLYSEVMVPFNEFTSVMKDKYQARLKEHKRNLTNWKIREGALKSNLSKSIKLGDDEEEAIAQKLFDEHLDLLDTSPELKKPKKFNLIYEDASFKALIDGLRDQPNAAVLSSEAITFFKGRLKDHLGLLNKAWSGETYPYHRPEEEDLELNARLTILLMVQPQIFMNYLKKTEGEPGESGFLSRFLITNVTTAGNDFRGLPERKISNECLTKLHEKMSALLEVQKPYFEGIPSSKRSSPLRDDVKSAFSRWLSMLQYGKSSPEFSSVSWEHIPGHLKKSGSQAIRIATIFSVFENGNTEICPTQFYKSSNLVDWHTNQAAKLFYPMSSEYKFHEDVCELFEWIKHHIRSQGKGRAAGSPIPKQMIENRGPNRFRTINQLTPILDELIALGKVVIIRYRDSYTDYVAEPVYNCDENLLTVKNPRQKNFQFIRHSEGVDGFHKYTSPIINKLQWND